MITSLNDKSVDKPFISRNRPAKKRTRTCLYLGIDWPFSRRSPPVRLLKSRAAKVRITLRNDSGLAAPLIASQLEGPKLPTWFKLTNWESFLWIQRGSHEDVDGGEEISDHARGAWREAGGFANANDYKTVCRVPPLGVPNLYDQRGL